MREGKLINNPAGGFLEGNPHKWFIPNSHTRSSPTYRASEFLEVANPGPDEVWGLKMGSVLTSLKQLGVWYA